MRPLRKSLFAMVMCALMLAGSNLGTVYAQPSTPDVVLGQVSGVGQLTNVGALPAISAQSMDNDYYPVGCIEIGDYTDTNNGDYVVVVECDGIDDCSPAIDFLSQAVDLTMGGVRFECSQRALPLLDPTPTPNPLGGPPPIDHPAPIQTRSLLPLCDGATCDNVDPSLTSCPDDSYTIYSEEAKVNGTSYGVLEMRYSPTCNANWVRFTPWGGHIQIGQAWVNGGALIAGRPWIWRQGIDNTLRGPVNQSDVPINPLDSVTYWTSMVPADGITCFSVDIYQFGGNFDNTPVGPSLDDIADLARGHEPARVPASGDTLTADDADLPEAGTTWADVIGTFDGPCGA